MPGAARGGPVLLRPFRVYFVKCELQCTLQNKCTFHGQELIDDSVMYIVIVDIGTQKCTCNDAMGKMRNCVMHNGNVKCAMQNVET